MKTEHKKSSDLRSENKQACSVQSTNWFVYLLRCADQSLYCGITTNVERRLRQHNGEIKGGAKYTKTRQPCVLVYSELADNRSSACKREYQIKKLTREQKSQLLSE